MFTIMADNKKKRKIDWLLILAVILFMAGIVLLLIDPIKNMQRKKKINEVVNVIESQFSNPDTDNTEITYVVNINDFEINGEDYDNYEEEDILVGDDRESDGDVNKVQETYNGHYYDPSTDTVTLVCIGMLQIDAIDMNLPIWDECTTVSLRYGAGHYEGSVLPGEVGNCSILGHHMRAYGSLFNRLNQITYGNNVKITVPDGTEYNYVIDAILTIDAEELNNYIRGSITETKQLTLVTCAYDGTGRQLRLVVIGHMVE